MVSYFIYFPTHLRHINDNTCKGNNVNKLNYKVWTSNELNKCQFIQHSNVTFLTKLLEAIGHFEDVWFQHCVSVVTGGVKRWRRMKFRALISSGQSTEQWTIPCRKFMHEIVLCVSKMSYLTSEIIHCDRCFWQNWRRFLKRDRLPFDQVGSMKWGNTVTLCLLNYILYYYRR